MAIDVFFADVATLNPLAKDRASVQDAPRIERAALDEALNKSVDWLFAGPLRGFDKSDFEFLPSGEVTKLSQRVTEFNASASELRTLVRGKPWKDWTPAEESVANQAREALREIMLSLEQDRYFSGDALRLGKRVEQELGGVLPEGVAELRFYAGEDSAGEPAIWVWAFLTDEATATEERLLETGRRVRPILRAAARAAVPDHYPYISFRGVNERVEAEVE